MDIVGAMQADAQVALGDLKVDGGASRNDFLMQFQADVLETKVVRPTCVETTAKGAAYLAGLASGFWQSIDEIKAQWEIDRTFKPELPEAHVKEIKAGWTDAVKRSLSTK